MSKLSDTTDPERPPPKVDPRIIRNRKRNPLHPEDIAARLAEASAHRIIPTARIQKWKFILFINDHEKHFCKRVGTYQKACKDRAELMESGTYEKVWMITEGYE